MPSQYNFTAEQELDSLYKQQIEQVWQTGEFSHFHSFDLTRIEYALFTLKDNEHTVVLSPGRIEGYLKYKELTFNLLQNGFNVAIIDYRGQGLSQRLQLNPHKGFVDNFDDYAIDLKTFISDVVTKKNQGKLFMLAHSMGGAIAIRYLQTFPNDITAIAMTSPMISIDSGSVPYWLGKLLINAGAHLNNFFSNQAWYFLGHKDYVSKPFATNQLTHSKIRYKLFRNEYQQNPEMQLGGVTFKWLAQAIKSNKHIFEDLSQYTTPTLVLQAGQESIVSNSSQNAFCLALAQQQNGLCEGNKPLTIKGAKHEILFEQDSIRNQALSHILDWFNSKV